MTLIFVEKKIKKDSEWYAITLPYREGSKACFDNEFIYT